MHIVKVFANETQPWGYTNKGVRLLFMNKCLELMEQIHSFVVIKFRLDPINKLILTRIPLNEVVPLILD